MSELTEDRIKEIITSHYDHDNFFKFMDTVSAAKAIHAAHLSAMEEKESEIAKWKKLYGELNQGWHGKPPREIEKMEVENKSLQEALEKVLRFTNEDFIADIAQNALKG